MEDDGDGDCEYRKPSASSKFSRQSAPSAKTGDGRVIAHVDLDCFYVQVERYHNPNLLGKPVAVVQYNPFGDLKSYAPSDNRFKENGSIIAVSYEARAQGVKRIMRGAEAKKVCADMILVQVPTSHGKADLTIYREASAKILKVLSERYPNVFIERASVDEVYLDVSVEASRLLHDSDSSSFISTYRDMVREIPSLIAGDDNKEMKMSKNDIRNGHSGQGASSSSSSSVPATTDEVNWFDRPDYLWSTEDRLLLAGAVIINQLRSDVFTQLGFTCSAGLAMNKMLAKLASGMHKPNKQTLVSLACVEDLMRFLPFSRVQGFGGKLGAEITQTFGEETTTMSDLISIGYERLSQKFGGETAQWIMQRAKGIDFDPVQQRALPISIGCSKSFRSTNILLSQHVHDGTVLHWLQELASELSDRIAIDTEANHRQPRQLHVGTSVLFLDPSVNPNSNSNKKRDWWVEQGMALTKTARMPAGHQPTAIAKLALTLINKALTENTRIQQETLVNGKTIGLTYLSLSSNNFEEMRSGKSSIFSYLLPKKQMIEQQDDLMLINDNEIISDVLPIESEEELMMGLEAIDARVSVETVPLPDTPDKDEEEKETFEALLFQPLISSAIVTVQFAEVTETRLQSPPQAATSKGVNNKSVSLAALHAKYMKDTDLETFLSLPQSMQHELINAAAFSSMSDNSRPSSNGGTNKKRKSDATNSGTTTGKLSGWLQKEKK